MSLPAGVSESDVMLVAQAIAPELPDAERVLRALADAGRLAKNLEPCGERRLSQGRDGAVYRCHLPAGHAGWHQDHFIQWQSSGGAL